MYKYIINIVIPKLTVNRPDFIQVGPGSSLIWVPLGPGSSLIWVLPGPGILTYIGLPGPWVVWVGLGGWVGFNGISRGRETL